LFGHSFSISPSLFLTPSFFPPWIADSTFSPPSGSVFLPLTTGLCKKTDLCFTVLPPFPRVSSQYCPRSAAPPCSILLVADLRSQSYPCADPFFVFGFLTPLTSGPREIGTRTQLLPPPLVFPGVVASRRIPGFRWTTQKRIGSILTCSGSHLCILSRWCSLPSSPKAFLVRIRRVSPRVPLLFKFSLFTRGDSPASVLRVLLP